MPKPMLHRLLLTALMLSQLIPLTAAAGWYQIELIAFSRAPEAVENPEYWTVDPGLPEIAKARQLQPAGTASPDFTRLEKSELNLDAAYWSLRSTNGRLKPLVHLAWRQNLDEAGETVYLASISRDSSGRHPELEGNIHVSVKRYLHIELDLLLRRSTPAGPSEVSPVSQADEPMARSGPQGYVYRMQAHRRMRKGEEHYIDHPLMGVLIRIDPYQPDVAG